MLNQDQKQQPNEQMIEEVKSHARSMITTSYYGQLDDATFDDYIRGIIKVVQKSSPNLQPLDEGELEKEIETTLVNFVKTISKDCPGNCPNATYQFTILLKQVQVILTIFRRYAQGKDKAVDKS